MMTASNILILIVVPVLQTMAGIPWAERQEFEYEECHDDLKAEPGDFSDVRMRFPWLAFLQYIRIKDGTLYHGHVPRVVVVNRQYVLATVSDAATDLPLGYALGNVVLKDYDRDEEECGITMAMLRAGVRCSSAVLVMPADDVLLHPEFFQHDRPPDSLALIKLKHKITSNYMIPICHPYFDFVKEVKSRGPTFIVDFENKNPQALDEEIKYSQRLQILPADFCNVLYRFMKVSQSHWRLGLCTNGCGMARGAPLVSHQPSGLWVLVGLASRPVPCSDLQAWRSKTAEPVHYISVLPYVDWIINNTVGPINSLYSRQHKPDDPFGYRLLQAEISEGNEFTKVSWAGRVARYGECTHFRNKEVFHYYKEVFKVEADSVGDITYSINLQPDVFYKVVCVKIDMPNRNTEPRVAGIGHWNVTVFIIGAKYKESYQIVLEVLSVQASDEERVRWQDNKEKKRAMEQK